ncbi:MAG: PEP-CTERM sorting domain-containing protein [Proteobacteria bacterium]|nr:PEP-CTERM sorting domain-containing protein [Pseudomonadota bacterium]
MKKSKLTLALQAALLFGALSTASAHVSYNGRDFGSYSGFNTNKVISNQYVTSDYGWADATDTDLGDSHKTRAFKFSLSSNAWVTLRFEGLAYTSGATSYSALALPAFSLYSGLAAAGTHDGSPISIAWRDATYGTNTTKGSLNALGDWKIGSDAGTTFADLSSLTYIGNAADGTSANYGNAAGINGDGNADGVVTGSFYLSAGDYSVFIGGANYSGVNTNATYGIQGSFTAVPEPSTWGLLIVALAMGGLVIRAKQRKANPSTQL